MVEQKQSCTLHDVACAVCHSQGNRWENPDQCDIFQRYVNYTFYGFMFFGLLSDQSVPVRSSASRPCLNVFILEVLQGSLSNPAHIKSTSGNLAESRYLLRWSLPMADPEHPLTHLLHRELWTWGPAWSDGKTGPKRWSESPPGTLVSFRPFLLHYHLCRSVFPFICSQSLAPSSSHPGIRWTGREVLDGAAADMGKGRINITKRGDFHFSFFLNMTIDTKHDKKCENF